MEAKISLKDVRFFAFHGLYKEENHAGNWFVLNMDVFFELKDPSDINQTVDYTVLFEIARDAMKTPEGLMEYLAKKIMDKSKLAFPIISKITLSILKEKPAITNIVGQTAIELTETYST